ncbi:MFS transporter [Mycolicibacterium aichiense]|uniref:MFS transporter n=1 Tax=Mycolicibacterium aichiense TaxID=1799 RepID=A0AAD1ME94_9MYCO|nr:MFS transporter [Mycolicibacterium aichiense]MCV7021640.1 MFS transporter [Mycolicibacterium aichiense]BBX08944.1 MFS transporter [Mycolicibacterium aichiense]STZ82736.1 major facilitator superfamily transporter [Mycolicibacterium aichiense]
MRAWIVWSTGTLAYIVAVLDRTTMGVSGLDAAKRFSASPGVLSTFVVLQVIVYASAQIPAGLLLDRFGSKKMILTGATLMVAGQLVLAMTVSLPTAIAARAVVGLGDAFTFISVLRLVPHWFTPRQIPLVTQLTGISGQLGQVLSAVPFLSLLIGSGWTRAYLAVAAFGVLSLVLTLALVKNTPPGVTAHDPVISVRETLASVKTIWMRPGTRLGFFTHMGTQFSVTVFALMWGVPYLTVAQNLSRGEAGTLLTISVVAAIVFGVLIGIITGRHPHRRSWIVLGIVISNALIWTVVLALPHAAPHWLLVVLIVVISFGGPGSMVGFDFARTFNPRSTLGTAQGAVNMGGFLASLLVMQAMGVIIGAAGGYSFESFRLAWCVQYVVWAFAIAGILITRRKARRTIGEIEESRYLLEFFSDSEPTPATPRRDR